MNKKEELVARISELENELQSLRLQQQQTYSQTTDEKLRTSTSNTLPLELSEYIRYGRQMILPRVGLPGQLALKKASVLVVGAGGLGCPVLLYLVGAGIGKIGIADPDRVDLSNLHRQILHNTGSVGRSKTLSAESALKKLNPNVNIERYDQGITAFNAVDMVKQYDVIVDCTDSPSTRYLISDAAVICGKPLVSGSALGTEGQLAVYAYRGGPCYRCVFPVPPPPESVLTCGEGGILGPVVGVIGVMQALETIKVIVDKVDLSAGGQEQSYHPSMTMFAAFDYPQWRSFRLRPKRASCIACGTHPTITTETIAKGDYEQICARTALTEISHRISVQEYHDLRETEHFLLDVRDSTQFEICSLPNSRNIPFTELMNDPISSLSEIPRNKPVYVICRFGNDSQIAVNTIQEMENGFCHVRDIKGGLDAWAETFPTDIIPKY